MYSVTFGGDELEASVVDGSLVVVVSAQARLGLPGGKSIPPKDPKEATTKHSLRLPLFRPQWQHRVERPVDDADWRPKMIQIR